MRLKDIASLNEAPAKSIPGASAFGQMANNLSGADKTKSSTGGTITKTPSGLMHTGKTQSQQPSPSSSLQPSKSVDTTDLKRSWIQYLKNNRIVALDSNPKTGQLTYRKKPTTDDLTHFLQNETHYDKQIINDVIQSIISRNTVTAPEPTKRAGGKVPGVVSQTPNAVRKREARAAQKSTPITEEFDAPREISEKDVEEIFSLLLSQGPSGITASAANTEPQQNNTSKKEQDIVRLKNLIRTGMTPSQRKELWLHIMPDALSETRADRREAKEILKHATQINHNISIEDLQALWARAGYPTDLNKIAIILNKAGFSRPDIEDIFDEVLGTEHNNNTQQPSPTIQKMADYIIQNGIRDEVVAYMQKEFGEELNKSDSEPEKSSWMDKAKNFGKKIFAREATNEEVKHLFTKILLREQRAPLREQEQQALGRVRK